MDITSHNDEFIDIPATVFVKRNGRWVEETRGNQLIIELWTPEIKVNGKGPTTLLVRADWRENGITQEITHLRVIFDGETGGVTSITKQLPGGAIEELERFSIGITHPYRSFFREKVTESV